MPKQPFTPAGVQAKITELYALSDFDLAIQADLVRSNFRTWVINNFILSTEQQAYVAAIGDKWIALSAQQMAMAMEHRLPVELVVSDSVDASKLIGSSGNMTVKDNGGVVTASGSLTFSISYE